MTAIECQHKYGSRYLMAKAVKAGMLHKVAIGVYSDGSRYRDVELLQTRYPASAVTMLSAYYYRNLTDVIPDKCHLATERDSTKIGDKSVVQYFVPKGTGGIGVESTVPGAHIRHGTAAYRNRPASHQAACGLVPRGYRQLSPEGWRTLSGQNRGLSRRLSEAGVPF
ncbi:MAG: hypothetical protein IIT98_05415 [Kiritimatiellae bacterium]|nr:hypothetical protein [Kiritimatiellia bacterium]